MMIAIKEQSKFRSARVHTAHSTTTTEEQTQDDVEPHSENKIECDIPIQ